MFIESLYIRPRFIIAIMANVMLFIRGYVDNTYFIVGQIYLFTWLTLLTFDLLMLYSKNKGIAAERLHNERFSLGDYNKIQINIESRYWFPVKAQIIDEVPVEFQERNNHFKLKVKPGETEGFIYHVRPIKRGQYNFGQCNVFVRGFIGLVSRRYKLIKSYDVAVYPSYLQLQTYEFLAISNRLQEIGIKKVRRVGQNNEFDQIRDYVRGDDFRKINWKASARRNGLMVNQYQDEKSQNVYCAIDMGRSMKMPFDGMSLLDYAINSTLVFSNIAIRKSDSAGLITFNHTRQTLLKAAKSGGHMSKIQEALYVQKTGFTESDFGNLYQNITYHIHQRSLLILFTNFESIVALRRQLKYFNQLNKKHLLVVVFFENTELDQILEKPDETIVDVYRKTLAEKIQYEKKLMQKELRNLGIQAIYTKPQNLTVDVINKYLELKSRNMI